MSKDQPRSIPMGGKPNSIAPEKRANEQSGRAQMGNMALDFIAEAQPGTTINAARSAVDLSVVVPTFNEQDNVRAITEALEAALGDTRFEIVFVDDDSTDETRDVLAQLAVERSNIRVIHRIGRRGLSTAVTEGMLSTTAPYIAVIDADLQHDERILPEMLKLLQGGEADLVIGSRYVAGGDFGEWEASRVRVSTAATRLAKLIASADISDPMSGFFAITRPALYRSVRDLSGQGYKILLDIVASAAEPLRIREIPYTFRTRQAGESKLDALIVWEYLLLLVDKLVGHIVPARFLSFMFIGGLGVFVHMAVLGALIAVNYPQFIWAQAIATAVAMVFNFFVNNTLTYRDRRLKGAAALTKGLITFMLVCSVGAVANVGVAAYLYSSFHYGWWIAGLAGILMGVVWNYAATSVFTWRAR